MSATPHLNTTQDTSRDKVAAHQSGTVDIGRRREGLLRSLRPRMTAAASQGLRVVVRLTGAACATAWWLIWNVITPRMAAAVAIVDKWFSRYVPNALIRHAGLALGASGLVVVLAVLLHRAALRSQPLEVSAAAAPVTQSPATSPATRVRAKAQEEVAQVRRFIDRHKLDLDAFHAASGLDHPTWEAWIEVLQSDDLAALASFLGRLRSQGNQKLADTLESMASPYVVAKHAEDATITPDQQVHLKTELEKQLAGRAALLGTKRALQSIKEEAEEAINASAPPAKQSNNRLADISTDGFLYVISFDSKTAKLQPIDGADYLPDCSIGCSPSDVRRAFGPPDEELASQGVVVWSYRRNGFEATFAKNKAINYNCFLRGFRDFQACLACTAKGLTANSSPQDTLRLYGKPSYDNTMADLPDRPVSRYMKYPHATLKFFNNRLGIVELTADLE